MKIEIPYLKQLTLISICIATFFLPIKTSLSNLGLIGLVITTILALGTNGFNVKNKFSSYLFFSPMVFFLPLLWGVWYSDFQMQAFDEITKYIFLGLTPLFLYRRDIDIKVYKKFALTALLIGSLVSATILLCINFYHFFQTDYPVHWLLNYTFTNFNFTAPLADMHPIYLGVYYSMSLAFLLFGNIKLHKLWRFVMFIIISLAIVFLASRIIYWVSFLMLCLFLIHHLPFKFFAVLVTISIIIGVFSFSLFENTYLYQKAVYGTRWELQENIGTLNVDKSNPGDSRFSRWKVALEIIKEKPWLGVGGGAENEVLLEKYKAYAMTNSIAQKYNAHNQYLGFGVRFGVLGILLLLLYFVKNTITAIKHQHLLFIAFLTILFWVFMIENIMDRNMGINFVALFGTLFYAEFLFANAKHKK